jgi:hypothetical protein
MVSNLSRLVETRENTVQSGSTLNVLMNDNWTEPDPNRGVQPGVGGERQREDARRVAAHLAKMGGEIIHAPPSLYNIYRGA